MAQAAVTLNKIIMFEKMIFRRILYASPAWQRASIPTPLRQIQASPLRRYSRVVPSIAQPSFWASLVPKPLRKTANLSQNVEKGKPRGWNPATFFIVIFLLIGSMSIQMIALRNDFAAFSRRTDAKMDLLREIIEKVQNGEQVDVEGLLGTGDPAKEKEWEEVLKEIEREDELWSESRRKKPLRSTLSSEAASSTSEDRKESGGTSGTPKTKSNAPPGFY